MKLSRAHQRVFGSRLLTCRSNGKYFYDAITPGSTHRKRQRVILAMAASPTPDDAAEEATVETPSTIDVVIEDSPKQVEPQALDSWIDEAPASSGPDDWVDAPGAPGRPRKGLLSNWLFGLGLGAVAVGAFLLLRQFSKLLVVSSQEVQSSAREEERPAAVLPEPSLMSFMQPPTTRREAKPVTCHRWQCLLGQKHTKMCTLINRVTQVANRTGVALG